MRTICDVCESAVAVLFCAADEAALCRSCDEKVHLCNKLASRHVRVGLADPNKLVRCDICENSPAFFYCDIDGTSLCLSCDMAVHVGGKRTHGRYLLLRQRVEFPGDKPGNMDDVPMQQIESENQRDQNKAPHSVPKEQMLVIMGKVRVHRLRQLIIVPTTMTLQEWCQHAIWNETPTNKHWNI
ncbi:hypothetical protein BRADI_4g35950v3 [Brachypodium distachyon]|uniref:B box-type domain-containing protein n=1 Tax=Brachypodium distachyon TaxID=15368 RepID=I1IS40_BRADI|nr:hypothetical protein BRADI_4g35950v3 [Brachypodium distachyon]